MATFILVCFVVFILAFIAKLIYEVQQNKKSIKIQQNEITADEVDAFQKLAGIKPINPNDELRQIVVKNNLNAKEQIVGELLKAAQNSEFPAPDQSIPMISAKLTTIELGSKEEVDPLASVPLSRVSKEAKQKMAEIAKQDISDKLEENATKYAEMIQTPKVKKKNPKQFDGVESDKPFVKTRKKATKKTNK